MVTLRRNRLPTPLSKPQWLLAFAVLAVGATTASAGVGDPQVRTDHRWYPGELACSTFERLFATQAALYERVTGDPVETEEQKVLAAWLWRNTHYAHGEEGAADLWGAGFGKGMDTRSREYWTGLFAHGFGLCGTTHSQWCAEMEALLGHGRGRGVGVAGHNSFEAFIRGGAYGPGQWVLLDHDLSTVIFSEDGKRLLSLDEVQRDWQRLVRRDFKPEKQHGWLVCGLHPGDGGVYAAYEVAEYLAGYSGPPPMVHLRRGETLRRYPQPGLADGKTFVFWGRNYNTQGIPGPERSLTWVNQPDAMHGSTAGAGHKPGQARYGNAVYTYQPNFAEGTYREGVADESDAHVTFRFASPYVIGATPPNASAWGVYEPGCTGGLVLRGKAACDVAISVDNGTTWRQAGKLNGRLDLTDHAKGQQQYLLRLAAGPTALADAGLTITTVCQANAAVLPRLTDDGCQVQFAASGQAVSSAGPNRPHAASHVVAGKFDSPTVTLELRTPGGEPATQLYAAAHVLSGNPPSPDVNYAIDYSTDSGQTWQPVVRDWRIPRTDQEPKDFWSQSLCWGSARLAETSRPVLVRFANDGGRQVARAEAHLVYPLRQQDRTRVTFAWTDAQGAHEHAHEVAATEVDGQSWQIPTGKNVRTRWIEFAPVIAP